MTVRVCSHMELDLQKSETLLQASEHTDSLYHHLEVPDPLQQKEQKWKACFQKQTLSAIKGICKKVEETNSMYVHGGHPWLCTTSIMHMS